MRVRPLIQAIEAGTPHPCIHGCNPEAPMNRIPLPRRQTRQSTFAPGPLAAVLREELRRTEEHLASLELQSGEGRPEKEPVTVTHLRGTIVALRDGIAVAENE